MAFRPLWQSLASEARGGKGLIIAIDAALKAIWDYLDSLDAAAVELGDTTGDVLRWNEDEQVWESKAQPIILTQVNLVPALEPVEDSKGGLYYRDVEDSLYVCTEGD